MKRNYVLAFITIFLLSFISVAYASFNSELTITGEGTVLKDTVAPTCGSWYLRDSSLTIQQAYDQNKFINPGTNTTWTNTDKKLFIECTDNMSGDYGCINVTEITDGNGNPKYFKEVKEYTTSIGTDPNIISVTLQDAYLNSRTCTLPVGGSNPYIDKEAPTNVTITKTAANKFTYTATDNNTSELRYMVTNTNTTPEIDSENWLDTPAEVTIDPNTPKTYYVWVRDGANITSQTIDSFLLTKDVGSGTELDLRYQNSSGAELSTGCVLDGTQVYVSASTQTGYSSLELTKNNTAINSGTTHTINAATTFSSSASLSPVVATFLSENKIIGNPLTSYNGAELTRITDTSYTLTTNQNYEGAVIPIGLFESGKTYILKYDIQKTSGTLLNIGGHSLSTSIEFNVDNEPVQGSFISPGSNITDDNNVHSVLYKFTYTPSSVSGANNNIVIQPNRGNTTEVTVDITNFAIYEVVENRLVTYGSTYGTLPSVTKTGYTVNGWALLPDGYTEIEYIESTGTQYINTGVKPDSTMSVSVDFETTTPSKWIFGSRSSQGNANTFGVYINGNTSYWAQIGGSLETTGGTINVDSTSGRHKIEVDGTTFKIDGINKKTYNNNLSAVDAVDLYLFTLNNNGSVDNRMFIGKTYNFKIHKNNSLVRNYIPCINESTGEVGLYDTVEGKFYGNDGTGDFVAGPSSSITSSTIVQNDNDHYVYSKWVDDISPIVVTTSSSSTWDKTNYIEFNAIDDGSRIVGYNITTTNTAPTEWIPVVDIVEPNTETMYLDGASWARVFHHNNHWGEEHFINSTEALSSNSIDKYSVLENIDDYKYSGKWEFLLQYPEISDDGYNRWTQTAKLTTDGQANTTDGNPVAGYTPISITWTSGRWGGLEPSTSSTTFIDGSTGHVNWNHAIGAYSKYRNGIPGPGSVVSTVDLWSRIDTLESSSSSNLTRRIGDIRGNTTYYVWVKDAAGNTGYKTVTTSKVDRAVPGITMTSTNNVATTQSLTATMTDNTGVVKYYDGTTNPITTNVTYTAITSTTSTSIIKSITEEGIYYISAVDAAGNRFNTNEEFYKTTLNANGGSVTPAYVITMSENSFTLPTPTRTGYTFGGWYTDSGCTTAVTLTSGEYKPTSSIPLYARWTPNNYSVKFNANGGSGSMSNESFTYDETKALTTNAFTRTGYTFTGWSTSSSDKGLVSDNTEYHQNATSASSYINLIQITIPAPFAAGEVYQLDFDAKGTGNLNSYFYGPSGYLRVASVTNSDGYTGTGTDGNNPVSLTSSYKHYSVRFTLSSTGTTTLDKYLLLRALQGNDCYAKNIRFHKVSSSSTAYTNGQSVKNLSTTNNATVNLYAMWLANELTFNNQTITKTYSTNAQTQNVTAATNGTGTYTYSKVSGDSTITVSSAGVITIPANKTVNPTGYTVVIRATDSNSGKTKDATYTIKINKAKITIPTSPAAKTYTGSSQSSGITTPSGTTIVNSPEYVTNGKGTYGDNTNFSLWTYDSANSYNGSTGSFSRSAKGTIYSDEFFALSTLETNTLSFDIKSSGGTSKHYSMIALFDIDKAIMQAQMYMFIDGTTTTLSQDLKAGDTVVHLTDLSGWDLTTTKTHQKGLIFWDYTNSKGFTYPVETYSRNVFLDLYADESSVNVANGTITLKKAWTGDTIPAGTPVSQSNSGGQYKYSPLANNTISTSWTHYSGALTGIDYSGTNEVKFPPYAVYGKVGFLWNNNSTSETSNITNVSVIGKSVTSGTNVGSYSIAYDITDKTNYEWSDGTTTLKTVPWIINPIDITSAGTATIGAQTYTGSALTPNPTIKINGVTLTNNTDYSVTYKNNTNPGTATAYIVGKGNYSGTKTINFTINKATCPAPTNVTIGTDKKVSWTNATGASSYQISLSASSGFAAHTNGAAYNAITDETGTRTVYVRSVCNTNYYSSANSTNATKSTTVYSVTLTAGTGISSVSGAGNYITGATTTIDATVRSGYTWKNWTGTSTLTAKSNVIAVDGNKSYTANATGNTYTATYYYQSNTTSGTGTVASIQKSCTVSNTSGNCSAEIPTEVTGSGGTYNNKYAGLSESTGNMTQAVAPSATTVTLTANKTYYSLYRTTVNIYYPSSASAATSKAVYQNQWFTSTSALSTTVLSTSTTGTTTNATAGALVSGYGTLVGFATAASNNTGTYADITALTKMDSERNATKSVYQVAKTTASKTATFYYQSNTTSGTGTVSSKTASGTQTTFLRCTSTTAAGTNVSNGSITIPTEVTGSGGTYNNKYVGVATAVGTMTSQTTANTGTLAYYAVYRTTVNIYYPSSTSAATSKEVYQNQWFTSASALSTTVLSTSTTGKTTNATAGALVSGYGTLVGFATSASNNTGTYSDIAELTQMDSGRNATKSVYQVAKTTSSVTATFYYSKEADGTTASVTASGTKTTFLRCTSTTAAGTNVSNGSITAPSLSPAEEAPTGTTRISGWANAHNRIASDTVNTGTTKYYATYRKALTIYYPTSTSAVTSKNNVIYRTAFLNTNSITVGTTKYTTIIANGSTSITQLTNAAVTDSVLENMYQTFGGLNTTVNDTTAANIKAINSSDVRYGSETKYYAVNTYERTVTATFYYSKDTSGTTASVTGTGTQVRNVYCTSTTAAATNQKSNGEITIPSLSPAEEAPTGTVALGWANAHSRIASDSPTTSKTAYYRVYRQALTIYYPNTSNTISHSATSLYRTAFLNTDSVTVGTTKYTKITSSSATGTTQATSVSLSSLKGTLSGLNATVNNTTLGNIKDVNSTNIINASTTTYYAVVTASENATFHYNSNTTSGEFTDSTATQSVTSTYYCSSTSAMGTTHGTTTTVPSAVKGTGSKGKYNSAYKGISSSSTTITNVTTFTGGSTYYAYYSSAVKIYYPKATVASNGAISNGSVGSYSYYRNEFYNSETTMTAVINTTQTAASNFTFTSSATNYVLYGFRSDAGTNTREYGSVSGAAQSDLANLYTIIRKGHTATVYYNSGNGNGTLTVASTTTATAYRYMYCSSNSAIAMANANFAYPEEVSASVGRYGNKFYSMASALNTMTANRYTSTDSTSLDADKKTLYAIYRGNDVSGTTTYVTNYYYGSSYTSRTLYRNAFFTSVSGSGAMTTVLSTSTTGTTNYSTAVGPGSSVWTGLSTAKDTTQEYTTVAAAANTTQLTLYTVYTMNISYAKGTRVSAIGKTSDSCKITTSNTSCSVTLPSITPVTGNKSVGWSTTNGDTTGTAAGQTHSITSNATTLYANAIGNVYKFVLDNQSATTAGTANAYFQFNTYQVINGHKTYYYTSSALTTPINNGTYYTNSNNEEINGVVITVPTRTGYTFKGYYTEPYGGGTRYISAGGVIVASLVNSITANTTLYAYWTETPTFIMGSSLNAKMKQLSGTSGATYQTDNTVITKFQRSTTAPSSANSTDEHIVSTPESSSPIYMWYSSGTIYWYCEASTVYFNPIASYIFAKMKGITSISFSGINTNKAEYMDNMFKDCIKLTSLDLSSFNTSKVVDFTYMFGNCNKLTSLNLSSFNTANATNMTWMFGDCTSLTSLNISSFNTSKVTRMYAMFYNCSSLRSLDVSSFNTSKVTDMDFMFASCSELVKIKASSSFVTTLVTESANMFSGCTSLDSGYTTYDPSHIDKEYARIAGFNGGSLIRGYFVDDDIF